MVQTPRGISIAAPEPEDLVNPNDEYYAALSPEGQVRYDEAMYGPTEVLDDEDGCKFAGAAENLPSSAPAPSLVTAIYDEINYRVEYRSAEGESEAEVADLISQCVLEATGNEFDFRTDSLYSLVANEYENLAQQYRTAQDGSTD